MSKNHQNNYQGILLLDKPTGISSNRALQRVKGILRAKKAGHTGSLDPLATGVLPICLGEATKYSQFLLNADKHYRVTAKLGIRTTTSDSEGEVVTERPIPELTTEKFEQVLEHYRGAIEQIPSMYSAIKHQGTPLYKLARAGKEVERKPRAIHIHQLDLISLTEDEFTLQVHCSKGTYIRTLVDDIGEALRCGAHVIALRRTRVSDFLEREAITLEQLETLRDAELAKNETSEEQHAGISTNMPKSILNLIKPIADCVTHLPQIDIEKFSSFYLQKGQPVFVPKSPTEGLVALRNSANKRFMGIGEILPDGRIAPKKLLKTAEFEAV